MRIPVTWLVEHLEFDETPTPDELAEAFTRIGIEVEEVSPLGPVTGPIVAGRVVEIEELTEFKKPIRFCRVEVGAGAGQRDHLRCDELRRGRLGRRRAARRRAARRLHDHRAQDVRPHVATA